MIFVRTWLVLVVVSVVMFATGASTSAVVCAQVVVCAVVAGAVVLRGERK